MIRGNDPILLTPGPLTTSLRTKQAMLNDWGSWDAAFNSITASIRRDVVEIVNGGDDYTCVPLAGQRNFFGRSGDRHAGASATEKCWCRTTERIARASFASANI